MSQTAFGFRPSGNLTGGAGAIQTRRFQKSSDGTDDELIYVGDPIKLNADGTVSRLLVADYSAAAGALVGVAVRIMTSEDGKPKTHSLPAQHPNISLTADTDWIDVTTDPNIIYEVVGNAAATQASIGAAFNVDVTSRNTAAGISGYKLDLASSSRTTAPFKVIGVSKRTLTHVSADSGLLEVIVNNGIFNTNTVV